LRNSTTDVSPIAAPAERLDPQWRTELYETLMLIEAMLRAEIPANPESPKNQRLARSLERELAKYFRALEQAFPWERLDAIYYQYVKESIGGDTSDMIDAILATFNSGITSRVSSQLGAIHVSGSAEMVTWGKTMTGIPIAYEGPPIQQAVDWAEKEGAKLVTQMDEETKRRLAKVVSDGIKNKRGVPGLSRDLRKTFLDMSRYRSQLIARTETRKALFQASHDAMVDMGIEGKEWVLGSGGSTGNCEDCLANAAQGVIPVNQEFMTPEGDIHPGCTCAIAPALLTAKPGVEAQVSEFQTQYRKADLEHCIALDKNGNTILAKAGESNHIPFTPDEFIQMKQANIKTFVHNHPSSNSFSADDLRFACQINPEQMEVVSPQYRFTLRPGKWGWGDADEVASRATTIRNGLFDKYDAVYAINKDAKLTSIMHTHEMIQTLAKEMRYTYRRRAV